MESSEKSMAFNELLIDVLRFDRVTEKDDMIDGLIVLAKDALDVATNIKIADKK